MTEYSINQFWFITSIMVMVLTVKNMCGNLHLFCLSYHYFSLSWKGTIQSLPLISYCLGYFLIIHLLLTAREQKQKRKKKEKSNKLTHTVIFSSNTDLYFYLFQLNVLLKILRSWLHTDKFSSTLQSSLFSVYGRKVALMLNSCQNETYSTQLLYLLSKLLYISTK